MFPFIPQKIDIRLNEDDGRTLSPHRRLDRKIGQLQLVCLEFKESVYSCPINDRLGGTLVRNVYLWKRINSA